MGLSVTLISRVFIFVFKQAFLRLPVSFPIDSSLQTWIISIAVPLVIGMPLEASKETGKTLSL